ncbi:hypothetical protein RR46_12671 [Papilio xuthus]|uniref:Uncharacterized protein n=1 Tax=Papilio xuthus TaxID=66420 RepID=A0A194PT97_PAPXU|nr:hypothetical protein RR46_12671 [Papilio xuthus]
MAGLPHEDGGRSKDQSSVSRDSNWRRPIGWPRSRWRDALKLDLRELQAMDWQEKAQDRRLRRCLVLEAKRHLVSMRQRGK